MRRLFIIIALLLAGTIQAQQQFHYPRPAADRLTVYRDLELKPGLKFDVYRPAGDEIVPIVIFANVGSPNYRGWPFYIGWGEAAAGAGIAGVVYQATQADPVADFDALMVALSGRAAELKIDPSRVVVWSASSNVQIGLPLLMDRSRDYIRGGVVYYGDAEIGDIRTDLPVMYVRAGLDRTQLNERIDRLIARALQTNAPWTIENNAGGLHGFEVLNDTEITRLLIHRTLSFIRLVTRPEVNAAYAAAAQDAAVGAAFARGDWPVAVEGYRKVVAARPTDGEAHLRLGLALLRSRQFAAALPEIEKAWELGRKGPRDVALPAAEAAAGMGNVDRAVHWLDILLSNPFGPPLDELRTAGEFANIRHEPAFTELLAGIEEQRRITAALQSGAAAGALRTLQLAKSGRLTKEPVLISIAYGLLSRGHRREAVEVFRIATRRYPASANAWESLGEAHEAAGDRRKALEASRRALTVLPHDSALTDALRETIRRAAADRIERLTKG